jgi:hypothetical protein
VIKSAVTKKNQVCPRVPLLVKIHPDFPDNCLREVCTAIQVRIENRSSHTLPTNFRWFSPGKNIPKIDSHVHAA